MEIMKCEPVGDEPIPEGKWTMNSGEQEVGLEVYASDRFGVPAEVELAKPLVWCVCIPAICIDGLLRWFNASLVYSSESTDLCTQPGLQAIPVINSHHQEMRGPNP